MAAKANLMPSFLHRENAQKVPMVSLWMTNIVVQLFLIVTLFSDNAFFMALELTSAMTLIPYLLVAAYALKLALTQETYEQDASRRIPEMIISLVATVYAILMLVAGGLEKLLLAGLILAPGTILFFISRRQQGLRVFGFWELVLFTVSVIAALSALYGLGTGLITI